MKPRKTDTSLTEHQRNAANAKNALAAAGKVAVGGRPAIPTDCPRCGREQPSARAAWMHCRKKQKKD
jgi:hypothetical protein